MSHIASITWYNATGGSSICLQPTGTTTFYALACCDCTNQTGICPSGATCSPPIPQSLTVQPTGYGTLDPYVVWETGGCTLYGFHWTYNSGQVATIKVCSTILCTGGVPQPTGSQCHVYSEYLTGCISMDPCP